MVLGMMARYLAFATRSTNSAMIQLHKELEEAARAAGANGLTTLLRITFPLLLPSCLVGLGLFPYPTELHYSPDAGDTRKSDDRCSYVPFLGKKSRFPLDLYFRGNPTCSFRYSHNFFAKNYFERFYKSRIGIK